MSDETISFSLTESERLLLVSNPNVPESLKNKMAQTADDSEPVAYPLTAEEVDQLFDVACYESLNAVEDGVGEQWESLMRRADEELNRIEGVDVDERDASIEEFLHALPPEAWDEIKLVLKDPSLKTPKKGWALLQKVVERRTGDSFGEIGGLAFDRFYPLITREWNARRSPLKLDWRLPDEEYDAVFLFGVAVVLLMYAVDNQGTVPLTKEGLIAPKALEQMIPNLQLPDEVVNSIPKKAKHFTEAELLPLHKARVILQESEILNENGNRLELTPLGLRVLVGGKFGRLFVKMFRTYFQQVDIAYFDNLGWEDPVFQDLIPCFLHRLSLLAPEWMPLTQAADFLVPSDVRAFLPGYAPKDLSKLVFNRFLLPLMEFGLVEFDEYEADWEQIRFQKSPLFEKLIRFDFQSESEGASVVLPDQ